MNDQSIDSTEPDSDCEAAEREAGAELAGSVIQAWLTRMYERHRTRYAWSVIGVAYAVCLLSVVLVLFLGARFYGLSTAQFGWSVLITEALLVVLLAAGTWSVHRELRWILAWVKGDRSRAEDAALAAQTAPRRAAVAVVVPAFVLLVPAGTFVLLDQAHRLTIPDAATLGCGGAFVVLYAFLIAWYWLEVATRPGLKDIARSAPAAANRVHGRPIGLGFRLLVGLLPATDASRVLRRSAGEQAGIGRRRAAASLRDRDRGDHDAGGGPRGIGRGLRPGPDS